MNALRSTCKLLCLQNDEHISVLKQLPVSELYSLTHAGYTPVGK